MSRQALHLLDVGEELFPRNFPDFRHFKFLIYYNGLAERKGFEPSRPLRV